MRKERLVLPFLAAAAIVCFIRLHGCIKGNDPENSVEILKTPNPYLSPGRAPVLLLQRPTEYNLNPHQSPEKGPGALVQLLVEQQDNQKTVGKQWCEELYENGAPDEMHFEQLYNETLAEIERILTEKKLKEGHSQNLKEQTWTYLMLAKNSRVKTVCETGFNAGHSALLFLSAKPDVKVFSFDIGSHDYSKPTAELLQKTFPGRLTVTWGNSLKTLPDFAKNNPYHKCDIVIVDGGHSYDVARADLVNFRTMATLGSHIVIIDDYPSENTDLFPGVAQAWKEQVQNEQVQEYFKCQFEQHKGRGFAAGIYSNFH